MYQFSLHAALTCCVSNWSFEYQCSILIQEKAVVVACVCKEENYQINGVCQEDFVPSAVQQRGLKGAC